MTAIETIPPPPGYDDASLEAESSGHWQDYWLHEAESADTAYDRARALNKMHHQHQLMDLVAHGNSLDEARGENDDESTAHAAYELYLELGPDDEMQGSAGFIVALAGRVYNDAVGEQVVAQEAYTWDFLKDTSEKPGAIAATTYELLRELQPHHGSDEQKDALGERLGNAKPAQLLRVADMLTDASYAAEDPRIKKAIQNSAEVVNASILSNPESTAKERQTALNLHFDLAFSQFAEQGSTFQDYQPLMEDYIRKTKEFILSDDKTNGSALETFVPFIARYSAWYDGQLNNYPIRHASQRSDSPHDGRFGREGKGAQPKHSYDIAVFGPDTEEPKRIQLKSELNDHGSEYDLDVVSIFDGGIRQIIERHVTDPETQRQLISGGEGRDHRDIAFFNTFVWDLVEATVDQVAISEDIGRKSVSVSNFERTFAIKPKGFKDIVEDLQEINAQELFGKPEDATRN